MNGVDGGGFRTSQRAGVVKPSGSDVAIWAAPDSRHPVQIRPPAIPTRDRPLPPNRPRQGRSEHDLLIGSISRDPLAARGDVIALGWTTTAGIARCRSSHVSGPPPESRAPAASGSRPSTWTQGIRSWTVRERSSWAVASRTSVPYQACLTSTDSIAL